MAEVFFELVRSACFWADLREFGFYLDVSNLHRLRELMEHVIPALLHVRIAQELLFENAHQPIKNAVVSGNPIRRERAGFKNASRCGVLLNPRVLNVSSWGPCVSPARKASIWWRVPGRMVVLGRDVAPVSGAGGRTPFGFGALCWSRQVARTRDEMWE